MNFRRPIMIAELWRPEVARRWEKVSFFAFFLKTSYGENFQNSVPKGFIATPIDVLCSNFVKFDLRDLGKIVRCLSDKKFHLALQLSLLRGSRPKSVTASPENVLRVFQISSKSIHFRWSYIRTREHRHSTRKSESNIRLKPSFEPNNDVVVALRSLPTTVVDKEGAGGHAP